MREIPKVKDLMSKQVFVLRPNERMTEAMRHLTKRKISGAPVVDKNGQLVGILSEKDFMRMFFSGIYNRLPGALVRDYMSTELTTCSKEDDLITVSEVFFRNTFRRLPVVQEGRLVGLISRRDVLKGGIKLWEHPEQMPLPENPYYTSRIRAAIDTRHRTVAEEVQVDAYL